MCNGLKPGSVGPTSGDGINQSNQSSQKKQDTTHTGSMKGRSVTSQPKSRHEQNRQFMQKMTRRPPKWSPPSRPSTEGRSSLKKRRVMTQPKKRVTQQPLSPRAKKIALRFQRIMPVKDSRLFGRIADKLMTKRGMSMEQAMGAALIARELKSMGIGREKGILIASLVKYGGRGDLNDAVLVAKELTKLPMSMLQVMDHQNTKVVVCRDSMTDYDTEAKGMTPMGYTEGTWDDVPGAFKPSTNEVIVSTTGHPSPKISDQNHSSSNLTLHEVGHSISFTPGNGTYKSETLSRFMQAYSLTYGDIDEIKPYTHDYYEDSNVDGGLDECFAETFAMYFEGTESRQVLQQKMPEIYKFWSEVESGQLKLISN